MFNFFSDKSIEGKRKKFPKFPCFKIADDQRININKLHMCVYVYQLYLLVISKSTNMIYRVTVCIYT